MEAKLGQKYNTAKREKGYFMKIVYEPTHDGNRRVSNNHFR